jgi:hypothetical protein
MAGMEKWISDRRREARERDVLIAQAAAAGVHVTRAPGAANTRRVAIDLDDLRRLLRRLPAVSDR